MMRTPDRERVMALLFYASVVLLSYLVYRIFRPFLVPLGWAGVLVIFCYPWHVRLEQRLGRHAAAISTAAVALVLIAPMLLVAAAFVNEALHALQDAQQTFAAGVPPRLQAWWTTVQHRLPAVQLADPAALMSDAARRTAALLAAQAGAVLQNVALFVFDLIVVLFATFFLFRDAAAIVSRIRGALPFDEHVRERMITETREIVTASVSAGLIVAGLQGLLGGIAFALLGLGAPVFWGVVMGFFSMLPLVGAWVVWLPASVWLLLNGYIARGLILMGLGAGIVSAVDNVLRPALLSGRSQLNGLLIFISMLGGVAAFGMLGIVLGPILVATAAGLLEAYTGRHAPPA